MPDTSVEVKEGEEPKMKTVTRTAMQWEVRLSLLEHVVLVVLLFLSLMYDGCSMVRAARSVGAEKDVLVTVDELGCADVACRVSLCV